ncbi:T6SS immunity protein Tli4 family protein [Serratia rubidaea]|uniref:T6SS immunity protein Tli4 family protein n=1 Tax=Serratia rubidaea TaxID=61652 RepID=UPI0023498636|nr:T6SS immunity protein Tli4 family protein [Serratia rubidaea]MDC6119679.1 T6SS immunity protein Tli4 family protein [Serratia rubidaea]
MTDKLFAQTKPQCIGRYLFEVPASFTNILADRVQVNDVRIASKRLYRPAFEQRIRLREQELGKKNTVNIRDQPFLKQVYRINDNTVIFDRNENESVTGSKRILEGHLYRGGVAFTLYSEFLDHSDPKYLDKKNMLINAGLSESKINTKANQLAEMKSLLSRINGRVDDEVPTQAGICIPNGFISDGNVREKEEVALLYGQGDFFLSVRSDNTHPKESGLLERSNEINAVAIRVGAHTLQKGAVILPGIDAEEWLLKGKQEVYQPEDKTVASYKFVLYGNEKIVDNKHPLFSVQLHNSGFENKNYTDSQLVDIWERITRTFRYRPNAF